MLYGPEGTMIPGEFQQDPNSKGDDLDRIKGILETDDVSAWIEDRERYHEELIASDKKKKQTGGDIKIN